MSRILITGSSGLIGSELVEYFAGQGWEVHGIDNNARMTFFGVEGDTSWNRDRLKRSVRGFSHHELSILDRTAITAVVRHLAPAAVIHCAAQPSHSLAATVPYLDFETNAIGTLNVLEAVRQCAPEAPFVHFSTNKVYGDAPNAIRMRELVTRWDFDDAAYVEGIPETMRIDQSTHTLFGASKVAADILVQEYGREFGMFTVCLRGGCLTGPSHSGVELHGFLSYLVRCNLEQRLYRVLGYQGKQVRDNIHSHDVARFVDAFLQRPRRGAVYNLGGGKTNTISILEAFALTQSITGIPMRSVYVDHPRQGDHICYYSDLRRMRADYPEWGVRISIEETIQQIVDAWRTRLA